MRFFITALLLLISTISVHAQLSGDYTVGGTSPNYATIKDAVTDLETQGVSGPVNMLLRTGTYNERVMIKEINGASASARVTFTSEASDSSLVTLLLDTVHPFDSNYVFFINGADYITLSHLTLTGPSGSHSRVLTLDSGAHHVNIQNCVINGDPDGSASFNYATVYSPNGSLDTALVFQNNQVNFGGYGLVLYGKDENNLENGTLIDGNTFTNNIYGQIIANQDNLLFTNNVVIAENPGSSYGVQFIDTDNETKITGNRMEIYGPVNQAIRVSSAEGTADSTGLIANNFIYMGGEGAATGIQISGGTYQNVYYNSVHIAYSYPGTYALSITGSNHQVLNNIFYASNDGRLISSSAGVIDAMDHNVLFTTASGPTTFAFYEGLIDDFDDWKTTTGFDANSVNIDPLFLSDTDLRTANPSINGLATPVPDVTVDIEGEARDATNPDSGADEFFVPDEDAGIISIDLPKTFCESSLDVFVTLKNFGANPLTAVNINWEVNEVVQTPLAWTGNLASGDEISVQVGSHQLSMDAQDFEAYTSLPNGVADQNAENDSSAVFDYYQGLGTGTYTIGGTSPDFASFNDAVSALSNGGICGPVVFDVRDGIYEESIVLEPIKGTSEVNTITFQSESQDSTAVTLQSTTQSGDDFVVHLKGADFITFDLITLKQSEESTFGHAIIINERANQNAFSSCVIQGVETDQSSTAYSVIYSLNDEDSSNVFIQNRILSGSYGFYYIGITSGERGTRIINNYLEGQSTRGIHVRFQDGIEISGNTIIGDEGLNIGLYVFNCDDSIRIFNNRFSGNFDEQALDLRSSDASEGNEGLIYNNFIQATSLETTDITGILLTSSDFHKVYYNSINITSENPTSSSLKLASGGDISLINNLFVNEGGGYSIEVTNTQALDTSNYNSFYTTGDVLGFWDNAETTDLAAWQSASGQDDFSISVDPFYASPTELSASSSLLDGKGTPVAEVLVDIDGEARDGSTPDIGADEFMTFPLDLGIVSLDSLISGGNCETTDDVYITLLNFGQQTVTSASISWSINGVAQAPINWTGSLTAAQTEPVFLGTATFTTPNVNTLEVTIDQVNGGTDDNESNNTLVSEHFVSLPEGNYTIGGDTPDFATFTEAVDVLNNGGICGPVVFSVRDGIYEEQISIQEVDGSSSIATITFISESKDSTAVTLTHETTDFQQNYTLQLFGTDFITLDGLGIKNTGTQFATSLRILGGAHENTITRCLLENPQGIGNVIITEDFSRDTANLFLENQIINGSFGINLSAEPLGEDASWNVVEGNVFTNQSLYGLQALNQAYLEVSHNLVTSDDNALDIYSGIYYSSDQGQVTNNRIQIARGRAGMYLSNIEGSEQSRAVIANNCIFVGDAVEHGMYVFQSNKFTDIVHNSVQSSSLLTESSALLVNYSNQPSTRIQNNSFVHEGNGYAIFLYDTIDFPTLDHNNYFTNGNAFAWIWEDDDVASFEDWKDVLESDVNSISELVLFDNDSCKICSEILGGKGNPAVTIATDPDGDERGDVVDIGVDEFDFGADIPITITVTGDCEMFTLDADLPEDVTFSWSTGALGTSIDVVENGTYSITANGACFSMGTEEVEITEIGCPLGIPGSQSLVIYPNPTYGIISLKGNIQLADIKQVNLLDLQGRFIKNLTISKDTVKPTIDLEGLPRGIYLLKLIAGDRTETLKIILEGN